MPDAISLVEIIIEEHWVERNMLARGCVTVESVLNARLKKLLNVGVGKKKRR